MKKIITFVIVLIIAFGSLYAQNTGISSVVNDSSSGMFDNAIDRAASVGEEFANLDHTYIFAGVANLEKVEVDTDIAVDDDATPNMLWTGIYKSGQMPWSLFVGVDAESETGSIADYVNNTLGGTETVVTGTTTTNYDWYSNVVTRDYNANRLMDKFAADIQFLTMLGTLNTGLYFSMELNDSSNQNNNYVETDDEYLLTSVAGTVPVTNFDFTTTKTRIDLDKANSFELGVPLFFQTGDLNHTANVILGLNTDMTEVSAGVLNNVSGTPVSNLGTVTNNEKDSVLTKSNSVDVGLGYALSMPGFGSNEKNSLDMGISLGMNLEFNSSVDETITQDVAYAGALAAGVNGTRSEFKDETIDSPVLDFYAGAGASHTFLFDLGPAEFGISPELSVVFGMDNNVTDSERVVISRTDNDADGAFTSAVDLISTTTTTSTAGATSTSTLTSTIALPVAVSVSPENWPISIILGSRPFVTMTNTFTSFTAAGNTTVHSVVNQGDGTNVSDATTSSSVTSNTTRSATHDFAIEAEHHIGLQMPIGEYVEFDIDLRMSTGVNILDFKDLVIQAIVALP